MQQCHSWCLYKLALFLDIHTMLLLFPLQPLMRAPVTMRHSLAKSQASGMHVALDHLPAPGLAATRHHASNAVTATGPCPIPRASTTPAVTSPWWGSSNTLPTLIHSPTGQNGGVDCRQRNTNGQEERSKRGYKEEKETDRRETHRRTEPESKSIVSKVS